MKWKTQKYNTMKTVPKSDVLICRGKFDILTHMYMPANFPGLTQALKKQMAWLILFYGPERPLIVKLI